jgi:hypothetical protein
MGSHKRAACAPFRLRGHYNILSHADTNADRGPDHDSTGVEDFANYNL